MSRRALPLFEPRKPIRAPHLNRLSTELGRITGLPTGGDDEYVDNACGRFYLPGSGTGTGIKPFIVTETAGSLNEAVYRTSHSEYGFLAKRVTTGLVATGSDLYCHADLMYGVIYTGGLFWATLLFGEWQVVSTGADFWGDAVTQEAIDANGLGMVEMFANGPLVDATTRTGVPISTSVDLEFDDEAQLFKCTAQDCPPA